MKFSSFSVILIFVVIMVMGFALAPLLDVGTGAESDSSYRRNGICP